MPSTSLAVRTPLTLEQVIDTYPFPHPVLEGQVMTLEPMQKIDIVRAAHWRRVLLDFPVGYGKTVISTAIALMLQPHVTIILVPPILVPQWVAWLESIRGAGKVVGLQGTVRERAVMDLRSAQWVVVSFAIFRNDLERLKAQLGGEVLTVVDEAHNIKSSKSKLFKAVQGFSAGRDLISMSGTIMSSPADAYAYIKLNTPETYRNVTHFENLHVAERDVFKQPKLWQNLDLMTTNLNARRLYRSKEEVSEGLPKARVIKIHYDLDPEHMKLYKRLMDEQLLELPDGGKIDSTTAQTLYHHAQQIISNWDHFSGVPTDRAAVFDLIDHVAEEIELGKPGASKLILWTIYRMTSRSVQEYMVDSGFGSVAAFGETDSKLSVHRFMTEKDIVNLTAQPGSAGAGLNPQYICRACAYIELPTRTIQFVQSSGRIDRKGQKYPPLIWLFIARGTVQEGLLQNLLNNDDLVNKVSGTKKGIRDMLFGIK